MNRRYQVFISSTFSDLQIERRAAYDAVLSLRHMPVGMEFFPAAPVQPWELIKSLIDDSDYYVLIIAARYGSINEEGLSFTEREYDYAVKAAKPILAFVHQAPSDLPRSKTDGTDAAWQKLELFRERVLANSTCSLWASAEDLRAKIMFSLVEVMRSQPARGWIRPEDVPQTENDVAQLSMLRGTQTVSEVIERSIIGKISKCESLIEQLPTGIDELDSIVGGGLPARSVVVVGARPTSGLTTVLANIAIATARKEFPVLVFSTKKNVDDYTQRLVSCLAGIKIDSLKGAITGGEFTSLSSALLEVSNLNIHLDNNCAHTFDTFADRCREQKRRCGALPLVIIDSLQFIGFDDTAKLGLLLKRLAIELDSTIVVGITLGRNVDLRPSRRPILGDIVHEDITNIADIVLFAVRPSHLFGAPGAHNTIELTVGQNSNGPIATTRVACEFSTGRIFSIPTNPNENSDDF